MSEPDDATCTSDSKHLAIVGTLMVVIIAMLAVLWVRERHRRIGAEVRAAQIQARFDGLQGSVGQLIGQFAQQTSTAPASGDGEGTKTD